MTAGVAAVAATEAETLVAGAAAGAGPATGAGAGVVEHWQSCAAADAEAALELAALGRVWVWALTRWGLRPHQPLLSSSRSVSLPQPLLPSRSALEPPVPPGLSAPPLDMPSGSLCERPWVQEPCFAEVAVLWAERGAAPAAAGAPTTRARPRSREAARARVLR